MTSTNIYALFLVFATAITLATPAARADTLTDRATRGQQLYTEGKFTEAMAEFEAARNQTLPADRETAARLDFNKACTHLALKQADRAERIFRSLDTAPSTPTGLRAAARYNLGHIEAARADEQVKADPAKAIETLKSAERFFRNALADSPGDADAAKNIELVQRRRAELMKQQQQKQEQKKEPKNGDDKKDQKQDQSQQQQDQEGKEQQQDQKKGDKKDQQQPPDQQQQDNKSGDQQQPKPGEQQPQPQDSQSPSGSSQQQPQPKPADDKGQNSQTKPNDEKNDKQPAEPAQPVSAQGEKDAKNAKAAREFDLAAAQTLDKERQRREQIKRMMQQMMRNRAAKVDKDW